MFVCSCVCTRSHTSTYKQQPRPGPQSSEGPCLHKSALGCAHHTRLPQAARVVHSAWTALPVGVQGAVVAPTAAPVVAARLFKEELELLGPLQGKPEILRESWRLRGGRANHGPHL